MPCVSGIPTFDFQYELKDHLGNTRVVFNQLTQGVAQVLQLQQYYAYGMQMGDNTMNYVGTTKDLYGYNGKEEQPDQGLDWIDYGARFYDAELGRWHVVDPLAEQYQPWSPYNYAMDNPIRYIDPDGMGVGDFYNNRGVDGIDDNRVYTVNTNAGPSTAAPMTFLESDVTFVGTVSDINLTFTGNTNAENNAQADGQFNIIQVVGDQKFTRMSIDAIGGPYGNGAPPNGDYTVNNGRERTEAGFTRDDFGFSFDLNPQFETERDLLRIHPDGNNPGTLGCVGLQCTGEQGQAIFNLLNDAINDFGDLNMNINIMGNPNNQGGGNVPRINE